jgi:3-oxoacyl-[acyl-carrier protein] reductase
VELGLAGKVALVTAASKGLGLASARALSAEGAHVVLSSRDDAALRKAAASLPGDTMTLTGDMSDPDTPARLVEATVERFGALHVIVANNGGPPPGRPLDVTDEAVHRAVDANLLSALRLVRAARPHMAAAQWGRVCAIASYGVVLPIRGLPLSNIARTGLVAWCRSAARELAAEGITINVACPGHHATDRMRELGGTGPMGDPDDFGKAVAFLCSEPAAFITGTTLVVDGGATAAQG